MAVHCFCAQVYMATPGHSLGRSLFLVSCIPSLEPKNPSLSSHSTFSITQLLSSIPNKPSSSIPPSLHLCCHSKEIQSAKNAHTFSKAVSLLILGKNVKPPPFHLAPLGACASRTYFFPLLREKAATPPHFSPTHRKTISYAVRLSHYHTLSRCVEGRLKHYWC